MSALDRYLLLGSCAFLVLACLNSLRVCFSILSEHYRGLDNRKDQQASGDNGQDPSKFNKSVSLLRRLLCQFFLRVHNFKKFLRGICSIFGKPNFKRGSGVMKRLIVVRCGNVVNKLLNLARRCSQKKFFGYVKVICRCLIGSFSGSHKRN